MSESDTNDLEHRNFCGVERPSEIEYCTDNYFSKDFEAIFDMRCVGQYECQYSFNIKRLVINGTIPGEEPVEPDASCYKTNARVYV